MITRQAQSSVAVGSLWGGASLHDELLPLLQPHCSEVAILRIFMLLLQILEQRVGVTTQPDQTVAGLKGWPWKQSRSDPSTCRPCFFAVEM